MDVKEENQQVNCVNQKLSNLSVEEIQRIERNFNPVFGMISERINQLMMGKNKFTDLSAKGCNEDDMVMMNEPKFDYEPSSSTGFSNYSPALENEFDYDINQWLNLPGLTNTAAEKSDKVVEENKSLAKGCNEDEDHMVMRNESPSLPLEPEFDYQSSSSMEIFNYNSGFENEFDYGINQEDWVNLPVLTNTSTDDGNVFEPFPDFIDLEFQALNNYAGGFTDMMINCC
ncbi:hypothetical protein MKW98_020360 [Papaver atlanticum]|uniref:Uncharacterized protein n=1 Tax=Papaver atlanticum TaxID=357466 RepID=A0AAD4X3B2_9MAGN|nr:hypothetical protein MKW98_020360 [Papaver atlanticum]